MEKVRLNEEINKMRKLMGLNEGLGLSIDEQMMSPKAVAHKLVEMLPDDYNEADVEKALDEYINTGAINIYVSEKFRRDDKWRNELMSNIRELKAKGLGESFGDDDYVDDISAAKSMAKAQQNFSQDAIDYVGGEDIWDGLSQSEQESVLADIEKDWDRSRSMGEAEEFDLSKVDNPSAYTDDIFDHNAERAEDPFDDGDSTRISMIAMSMLSDIQERAPEMADKINMVKRLIMKMNDKTEISHSELDAIMQGLD
jgi:hypothetical protein